MRIRITCPGPKPIRSKHAPEVSILLYPTLADVEVFVIDDDGTEKPLEGVSAVSWTCSNGNVEPVATLSVEGVELDVSAEVRETLSEAERAEVAGVLRAASANLTPEAELETGLTASLLRKAAAALSVEGAER